MKNICKIFISCVLSLILIISSFTCVKAELVQTPYLSASELPVWARWSSSTIKWHVPSATIDGEIDLGYGTTTLRTCGNYNYDTGGGTWTYNSTCWNLPGQVWVDNRLHTLYHWSTVSPSVSLQHGFVNLYPERAGSAVAAIAVYSNATSLSTSLYVATLPFNHAAATAESMGWRMIPQTKAGSVAYYGWEYRAPAVAGTTTHWAPVVAGRRPAPSSTSPGNCNSSITGILNSKSVSLGSAVDVVPQYTITGGDTGNPLTYVAGSSTTTANRYTASRNVSGASSITNGSSYTGIGSGNIVWSVRDYHADITNFTESIIVTTTGAPDVNIYFPNTDEPYDNRWMSNDTSADIDRQGGLDIQASSSINGNYDLSTFISGTKTQTNGVNKTTSNSVTNNRIEDWSIDNTTTDGIPATSRAFLLNDPNTSLSAESVPKKMYFDSTKPTIDSVTTDDDWATITAEATDDVSGLYDNKGVYFKFTPKGEFSDITTPNDGSDWTPIADYEATFVALADGEYDLYVYAKDNATNRSDAILVNNDAPIIVGDESEIATITIKKTVKDDEGNASDIFLISMYEGTTKLSTVALKQGDVSTAIKLDMEGIESKDIDISEIIPMDYSSDFKVSVINNKDKSETPVGGSTVTIYPKNNITIVVQNTFAPTGYFKGKDFVKNLFK